MKFSVALATYNGARHLQEQLDSLARQTLLPSELVVRDDGSTDDTLAIVEAFARTAPFPVHAERNAVNLGWGPNFLSAALACQGDVVAFCDQDDVWLPGKLARYAEAFADPQVSQAVHSVLCVTGQLRSLGVRKPDIPQWRVETMTGTAAVFTYGKGLGMAVRRPVLDRLDAIWPTARWIDQWRTHGAVFGHDVLVFAVASDLGKTALIPDALVWWRCHGANATARLGYIRRQPLRDLVNDVRRSVRFGSAAYARKAAGAAGLAELARAAVDAAGGPMPTVAAIADFYDRVARTAAGRAALYRAPTTAERLRLFRALRQAGGYNYDAFGRPARQTRARIKDGIVCLLGPPRPAASTER